MLNETQPLTRKDENTIGWYFIEGGLRVFVYRTNDVDYLYLRTPQAEDLTTILALPNPRLLLFYAIPPMKHGWGSTSERVVYSTYFVWSPAEAKRYVALHYANPHVHKKRYESFLALRGDRALETEDSWSDWVHNHWSETADTWYSIGYVINPIYDQLLNDFRNQYNSLNGGE